MPGLLLPSTAYTVTTQPQYPPEAEQAAYGRSGDGAGRSRGDTTAIRAGEGQGQGRSRDYQPQTRNWET